MDDDAAAEARERELDEKVTMLLSRCEKAIEHFRNVAQEAARILGRV